MRTRSLLLAASGLFAVANVHANLATGAVFGNHMVLQRGTTVPVFGTGSSGEGVTVTFNGQTVTATTASNGTWKASLASMTAGGPYTMTIKGNNTLTFTDVMVGEVWHCAGQSNMDTRMNYWEYPNLADSIKSANYPKLRYITMRQPGQTIQWQQVSPTTVGAMSAMGYFFGRNLLDNLGGVAIGIVNTSVGGTIIEQWLDPATKSADPALAADTDVGSQYNSWVKPVEGYAVKGTVWLQGENNTSSALYKAYGDRLQKMIPGWRKAWNQPDMPFLVAGLCHKGAIQVNAGESSNEAAIRESQRSVTDTMRLTWLSVLVDLGSDTTWHYPQKPQGGARLGLLARGAVYGANLVYESPKPRRAWLRGSTIVIPFDPRGSSLKLASGSSPTGFQVAGSNGAWSWASTATLKGDTILLTSSVASPTQIRHAWANQPIMNLWSAANLPATPFQLAITAAPVPLDCHGTANGSATFDSCGRCVGGTTGKTACAAWIEAENFCTADGVAESTNPGSYGSYLNLNNAVGSSATWVVNAASASAATLAFRFANGGTTDRTASISVNGATTVASQTFPTTGDWSTWLSVEVPLSLVAGRNTIGLSSLTADGAANLDRIGFVGAGVTGTTCASTAMARRSTGLHVIGDRLLLGDLGVRSGLEISARDLRGRSRTLPIGVGEVSLSGLATGVWIIEVRQDGVPISQTVFASP